MNIRVLDFEILTKHYVNYQNGINEINEERKSFIERLDPIKNEMESILKASQSGLVINNSDERSRAERFQILQQEAIDIDNEFQHRMKEMKNDLNQKSYSELEVIVKEWAEKNSIDLVTGKMEVIYNNDKYDSTNEILEVLKDKKLFI